jgi:hypothetical protein
LDWLRADLRAWAKRLEAGEAEDRPEAVRILHLWKQDGDLAGTRDEALDSLPDYERREWRKFWTDVDALLDATASALSERGRTHGSPQDCHHLF